MTSVKYLSQGYAKPIMGDWLPTSGSQLFEILVENKENLVPKLEKNVKHPGPTILDDCEASWLKN